MRYIVLLLALIAGLLVGCNDESKSENDVSAEEDSSTEKQNEEESKKQKFRENSPVWLYGVDVGAKHNFEGLDISLDGISFTVADENHIGVKVSFENLSHNKFEVYPGQLSITLDSGEEVDFRDKVAQYEEGSNTMDEKGQTFEGFYVLEVLKSVDEINNIQLKWSNYEMDSNDEVSDFYDFESNINIERD